METLDLIAASTAGLEAVVKRELHGLGYEQVHVEQIGRVLYTDYFYFFQAAGMVLLVAMIGAIVLTLRHKPGVKRQDIAAQTARTEKSGMRVVTPATGQGIVE